MSDNQHQTRRQFLTSLSAAAALAAIPSTSFAASKRKKQFSANDHIQVGAMGMGIMGFNNCATTVKVPGVKLVAACDLYDGRLKHAREVYGNNLTITKRAADILDNPAIDAVIISTTDHWHQKLAIAAMEKGKAVYCEKPMVHRIEQGLPMIDAQHRTGQACQIGSQRVSSQAYLKAKEFYEAGAIGQLILAEAYWDRQSANGAWQYSIPRDASLETIDWATFLGDAPQHEFDPVRFFRWRNYQDYGTGIAGDIFVHLFSGLHLITGALGPNRIYASGGLRYWKDGRDVPDIITGVYDYAETKKTAAFNLQVRVNFVDGGGGGEQIALVGTEGKMIVRGNGVELIRNKMPAAPGYGGWDSFNTFDQKNQTAFAEWYDKNYAGQSNQKETSKTEWKTPQGYSDHLDHHTNFYTAVRKGTPVNENVEFGFRAAASALATNMSVFEKRVVDWDPLAMKLI